MVSQLLVYCLCTVSLPFVYCLFTVCLPYFYRMCTVCVPYVYRLSTACLPYVYRLSTVCLPSVYHLSAICLPSVYRLSNVFLPCVFRMLCDQLSKSVLTRSNRISIEIFDSLEVQSIILVLTSRVNRGVIDNEVFYLLLSVNGRGFQLALHAQPIDKRQTV